METKYTSLELSKKLAEAGFHHDTEWKYRRKGTVWTSSHISTLHPGNYECDEVLMKYDILNDLCVKYAEELFDNSFFCIECGGTYPQSQIMTYLLKGKKQEAEEYLWKNCKFNNK